MYVYIYITFSSILIFIIWIREHNNCIYAVLLQENVKKTLNANNQYGGVVSYFVKCTYFFYNGIVFHSGQSLNLKSVNFEIVLETERVRTELLKIWQSMFLYNFITERVINRYIHQTK